MNWLHYLLQVNLYLILFYGFYHIVLRKETFFYLNRAYLLATSALAFFIPMLQFNWVRESSYTQLSDGTLSWSNFWRWSRDYITVENNIPKRITTFVECPSNEYASNIAILGMNNSPLGTKATFITDSQGKFDFKVRYGKNYSNWLRVNLKASTIVSTKDNTMALSFVPPVAVVDVDNTDGKDRPDQISPFGTDITTCLDYK